MLDFRIIKHTDEAMRRLITIICATNRYLISSPYYFITRQMDLYYVHNNYKSRDFKEYKLFLRRRMQMGPLNRCLFARRDTWSWQMTSLGKYFCSWGDTTAEIFKKVYVYKSVIRVSGIRNLSHSYLKMEDAHWMFYKYYTCLRHHLNKWEQIIAYLRHLIDLFAMTLSNVRPKKKKREKNSVVRRDRDGHRRSLRLISRQQSIPVRSSSRVFILDRHSFPHRILHGGYRGWRSHTVKSEDTNKPSTSRIFVAVARTRKRMYLPSLCRRTVASCRILQVISYRKRNKLTKKKIFQTFNIIFFYFHFVLSRQGV